MSETIQPTQHFSYKKCNEKLTRLTLGLGLLEEGVNLFYAIHDSERSLGSRPGRSYILDARVDSSAHIYCIIPSSTKPNPKSESKQVQTSSAAFSVHAPCIEW